MRLGAAANIALVVTLLIACTREHRILELKRPVDLLEQPYPMGYPSSAPTPNKVVRHLGPETVTILSDSYTKDFHVYQVRDARGDKGYIIDQPGMREKRSDR